MTKTNIEWTNEVWNPITGCSKVSAGCKNCYAERIFHRPYPGRAFTDVRCHPERLDAPLHWRKPRMIFVNSMSDLFHEDVPDKFIDQIFSVMAQCRRHTFQILTKRPERMLKYLSFDLRLMHWMDHAIAVDPPGHQWGDYPLPNVWLGVSVEDQATADERIPLLLQTPAAVRWVSAEPLLGPVTIFSLDGPIDIPDGAESPIHWLVAGGESGTNARPSHPNWFRVLRDQCDAVHVPFFFKQWGEWAPLLDQQMIQSDFGEWIGDIWLRNQISEDRAWNTHPMHRPGKKAAGRMLDGRTWDEYPKP